MTYWLGSDFAFVTAIPFGENPATQCHENMVGFNVESAEEVKDFTPWLSSLAEPAKAHRSNVDHASRPMSGI